MRCCIAMTPRVLKWFLTNNLFFSKKLCFEFNDEFNNHSNNILRVKKFRAEE